MRAARSKKYLWPYLEPQPVPQLDWLEVSSAKHAAYTENLYMRAHLLPSTLIGELVPKPEPRVTPPATVSQAAWRGAARCGASTRISTATAVTYVIFTHRRSAAGRRPRRLPSTTSPPVSDAECG